VDGLDGEGLGVMAPDRRTIIERAWAKVSQPKPVPGIASSMTPLQIAGAVVRSVKEPTPGGMTKIMFTLPPEDRQRVTEVANLYAHQRDCGRHGRPQDVLDAYAIDKETAEAVVDGLEMDYVAAELQRRRPTDADRPLPELTRRDYIGAAIDAHST
jgi:hypothetical protein